MFLSEFIQIALKFDDTFVALVEKYYLNFVLTLIKLIFVDYKSPNFLIKFKFLIASNSSYSKIN
jgi:hypothetical protein